MTGNPLVVVSLVCELRYLYDFLLSAVILEFSDRRAPVLNHKSCWMAFPNLYEHEKEAEKKFLGTVNSLYFNHITASQSTKGLKSKPISTAR